ncbi:MAG: acetylxylan esterase [Lentisphaeria bacterium]|nr:acetylxylan esterase [Lentisphaeria bacterium]
MRTIKTLAVLMLAAVISAGAFAAAKKVDSGSRILGKTDKNPVSYKVGEEITITLTPVVKNLPEGKYFVIYNLDADHNAAAKQKGKVDASKGDIVLKVKMSQPGFVRVVAKLVNEKGKVVKRYQKGKGKMVDVAFNGGAGVEIEKLQGKPEPADFDAYWATQKARLAEVPVKADIKLIKEVKGVKIYAVSVACPGPRPVTGYLTIPSNAKKGSLPASVTYHGYGVRVQKAPASGSKTGILFNVNAHGYDLEKDKAYYTEFFKSIRSGNKNYAMNPEDCKDRNKHYFNGMVLRVLRSLEFVRTLPEWNGKDLTVFGGSQGGLQSFWAAGLDDKVTKCLPNIPWCCDLSGRTLGRIAPNWGVPYTSEMDYYDAAYHAKRVKCPVVIPRAGIGDYTCPPSGIAVAYNNIKTPKAIYWMQGSTHGYIPDGNGKVNGNHSGPDTFKIYQK